MTETRITREQLMLRFAFLVAGRSTCSRMAVGAVLCSTDGRLSFGYNGRAHGEEHCADDKEFNAAGQCGCVHAELNALLKGGDTIDSIMYCSHAPCPQCARAIVNARVKAVHYVYPYRDPMGVRILEMAGIDTYYQKQEQR